MQQKVNEQEEAKKIEARKKEQTARTKRKYHPEKRARILDDISCEDPPAVDRLRAYRPPAAEQKFDPTSYWNQEPSSSFNRFPWTGHTELWSVNMLSDQNCEMATGQSCDYSRQEDCVRVNQEIQQSSVAHKLMRNLQHDAEAATQYVPPTVSESVEEIHPEDNMEQWRAMLGIDISTSMMTSTETVWDDPVCDLDHWSNPEIDTVE